ncbi:hypothetical protein [Dethiosulfatarculus sandiegensis]|uniref:Uncharacterized protein n=1 Tax=Dethiosulfatarculus sandiegensis TaxID=1429043 RepID=A0A0D2HZM0_9BACT|nr:hypothetical protein [Dethiosulfatarculus sandiegensis]KIX15728.1 hypothetical protein X474_02780 [Dethiosulfatarculus sandiegensis]
MFNRLGLFLILLITFMANCPINPSLSQAADFLGEGAQGGGNNITIKVGDTVGSCVVGS